MNKPKIIFFDVDGTLVPLKGAARPRTLEALRRLHQNGIRLCIATGRAPMEVPKFEGVSFDAFLTYNGSYCFTPEQDIFKNTILRRRLLPSSGTQRRWDGPLPWPTRPGWRPTAPNRIWKSILPSAALS